MSCPNQSIWCFQKKTSCKIQWNNLPLYVSFAWNSRGLSQRLSLGHIFSRRTTEYKDKLFVLTRFIDNLEKYFREILKPQWKRFHSSCWVQKVTPDIQPLIDIHVLSCLCKINCISFFILLNLFALRKPHRSFTQTFRLFLLFCLCVSPSIINQLSDSRIHYYRLRRHRIEWEKL